MSDIAITPKRLGQIPMGTYCPRCYWYLLRLKFHPPFDHFGGAIFKQMEQMQMAIVGHYLEEDGCLPEEFAPFCDAVRRANFNRHWSKFKYEHPSGVLLYGEADDIFDLKDGSIAVVDHKTALFRDGKDPYLPCYTIQLCGYCMIAEFGLDLGPASKAGLIYWEAEKESVESDPSKYYQKKKLYVPFVPKPLEVKFKYSDLDPLIKEVKDLWNAGAPPDGTTKCGDCKKLELLFAIEDQLVAKDQQIVNACRFEPFLAGPAVSRLNDRRAAWRSALTEFLGANHGIAFADDGMIAAWER